MSTKGKIGWAVVGLIAIGAVATAVSPPKAPTPAATGAAPTTTTVPSEPVATQAAPTESPTTTAATVAAPVTLLDMKGSATKNSKPFTTTGTWTLAYTFDCSSFPGGKGNFQVYVYQGTQPVGVAVNEYAAKGDSSTTQYETGELHLQMNSVCDKWHVTVTQP
jgi:hypothetical protein